MKNKILNVEITSEEERNELVKQLQEMKFEKPLPSSWEEYIETLERIDRMIVNSNVFTTRAISPKYEAMYKLEKLMKVYNDGWKPDWKDVSTIKHTIVSYEDEEEVYTSHTGFEFFAFKEAKTRDLFFKNFKPLIKQYFEID